MEEPEPETPRFVSQAFERAIEDSRRQFGSLLEGLEQRSAVLSLINGALRCIASGAPLSELVQIVAVHVQGIVGYEQLSLTIVQPDGSLATPYVVRAGVVAEARGRGAAPDLRLLEHVVRTRNGVLLSRTKDAPKGATLPQEWIRRGLGCEMVLPLVLVERCEGTFNLSARRADGLAPRDMRLLGDVLPALALAVARLRRG